jgi:pimeloyl-ACP methyl ester carboxylesterase
LGVDEHTIELDGSPVYYRSATAPGVPPLYLHGVPTSSDDWIPFLERTGGIAPDLIGFGRSGKAGNLDYTIDGLAQFVERFLDHIGVARVQLVAHDWGAAAGLVFAQRHPGRIQRMVLINALPLLPHFRWHGLARLWRRPVVGELAMGSTTQWVLGRALRRGTETADAWPKERVSTVYKQFDQGTQRAILRLFRGTSERQLAEAGQGLRALTMPVLIIRGVCDPWIPAIFGEKYGRALPNATLETLPDAGHWPWLDDPRVIDLVATFVQESG